MKENSKLLYYIKKTNKLLYVLVMVTIFTSLPNTIYGSETAHVIYEVDWRSDHEAKVTLKWNEEAVTRPIRIISWLVKDDNRVIIKYQQGIDVVSGFNSRMISNVKMNGPCLFILEEDLGANTLSQPIFPDLSDNIEGNLAIKHLYQLGIINGYPNGEFKPSGQVSRAEFSKLLFLCGRMSINLDSPITFTDVIQDHWARGYIYTLASRGIVKGIGNNLFNPNGTITIGEVVTILDRSFKLYGNTRSYSYSLENHWSNEYFLSLVNQGIIVNTDDYYYPYNPNKIATREDCAILLSRVLLSYHEVNE